MSYTFECEGFSFSSNSFDKVETVKRWFTELDYSVDKILNNEIIDRHALMVNLTCWGCCNITPSYWEARELRQTLHNDYKKSIWKYSSNHVFVTIEDFNDKVFNLTGWKF